MTETKNNPETSNQTELPHNPATNEEILALLRQLVGQDSNANEPSLETSPEQAEDDDENDIENHEAVGKLGEEEDDYTDDDVTSSAVPPWLEPGHCFTTFFENSDRNRIL